MTLHSQLKQSSQYLKGYSSADNHQLRQQAEGYLSKRTFTASNPYYRECFTWI